MNELRDVEAQLIPLDSLKAYDGKRYGLKNAKTGQVLYGATAKYKTESGAVNYAKRHGYEIL